MGAALRVVRAAGRKAWLLTHSAMSAWVAMGLINLLWQTYSAVICPCRVSYAMCVQLHGVQGERAGLVVFASVLQDASNRGFLRDQKSSRAFVALVSSRHRPEVPNAHKLHGVRFPNHETKCGSEGERKNIGSTADYRINQFIVKRRLVEMPWPAPAPKRAGDVVGGDELGASRGALNPTEMPCRPARRRRCASARLIGELDRGPPHDLRHGVRLANGRRAARRGVAGRGACGPGSEPRRPQCGHGAIGERLRLLAADVNDESSPRTLTIRADSISS